MVPIRRTVTDFLERARECAQLADKLTGDDKAKLLEVAEEWLRLAEEAAEPVLKTDRLPPDEQTGHSI